MSKLNNSQKISGKLNNLNVKDMLNNFDIKDILNNLGAKDITNNFNLSINKFLDLSNLRCPQPLLQTKKELNNLKQNDILLVKTTDPSFQIDIKVFANTTNNTILKVIEDNNANKDSNAENFSNSSNVNKEIKAHFTFLQKN